MEHGADIVLLPLNGDETLLRAYRQLHRREVSTLQGARIQGEAWRILLAEDDRLTAHLCPSPTPSETSETHSLGETLDQEGGEQRIGMESHDFKEGTTAFVEKRPARFEGR